MAATSPDLLRVYEFLRRADEGASTAVRPFEHGTAYFNDRLPLVWDRNFLLVRSAGPGLDADSLAAEAEALQGPAGLLHRKLVFEDEGSGTRLAPTIRSFGWQEQPISVMRFRDGDVAPAMHEAAEVDRAALEEPVAQLLKLERAPGGNEDAVHQLVKADLELTRTVDQRCFAKIVDGEVASYCRLFSAGGVAQIEEVATIPRFRKGGYSKAVVSRALAEAAADHELVFILAVGGSWTEEWYARLGFERVGLRYEFTRHP